MTTPDLIAKLKSLTRVEVYDDSYGCECCGSFLTSQPASDGDYIRWGEVEQWIEELEKEEG